MPEWSPRPVPGVDHIARIAQNDAFCWTRYGTESGEDITSILERKSAEREQNGGVFLWGIGNSVRPSLAELVSRDPRPIVRFSAMVSPPRTQDRYPERVRLWLSGRGLDGRAYTVPPGSFVTSGGDVTRNYHFALVCESAAALVESAQEPLYSAQLRNFTGGTRVGPSQVTAVVNRVDHEKSGTLYDRGFRANLVPPYFVTLDRHVSLPAAEAAPDRLRAIRAEREHEWISHPASLLPGF